MKKIIFLCSFMLFATGCNTGSMPEDTKNTQEQPDIVLTEDGATLETEDSQDENSDDKTSEEKTGSGAVNETGTGSYLSENLTPEQKIFQMKNEEIAKLSEKIIQTQGVNDTLLKTIESLENEPISIKDIEERTAGKDIMFKKCARIGSFQGNDWYDAFLKILEQRRFHLFSVSDLVLIAPESMEAGCVSDIGQLFIALIRGDEGGKGFGLIRYDMKMESAQLAKLEVHGKTNIAAPVQFGKREGNVIHLSAQIQDGECRSEMLYDYDFIKNEVRLVSECVKCKGKEDACKSW